MVVRWPIWDEGEQKAFCAFFLLFFFFWTHVSINGGDLRTNEGICKIIESLDMLIILGSGEKWFHVLMQYMCMANYLVVLY